MHGTTCIMQTKLQFEKNNKIKVMLDYILYT